MSNGKIWAKIVDNEIMQTHDEDPSGLWHPDQIAQNDLPGHWEEVLLILVGNLKTESGFLEASGTMNLELPTHCLNQALRLVV